MNLVNYRLSLLNKLLKKVVALVEEKLMLMKKQEN